MRLRGYVLVAVFSLFGTLFAAVPASAEDPPPPTLSLTAPGTVRFDRPTTLTATLAQSDAPVADATVVFQQFADGAWRTQGTAVTDAAGVATFTKPTHRASSTYRAIVRATDLAAEVVSRTVVVKGVRASTRIRLSATAWYVVDERSRTLSATWKTADYEPIDGFVTLDQKRADGVWRRISTVHTGADGIARWVVRPRFDTRYRVRGAQGPWWLAATSIARLMDNRPAAPPVAYPAKAPRPTPLAAQKRATGAGPNARISHIPSGVWRNMVGRSWHRGCPVGRSGLRLIRINYWGYDGYRYRGELVVNAAIARKTVGALSDMYAGKYPVRRMYRVDRFGWSRTLHGADDYKSMARGNTSAFNCRGVVGNPGVTSPHSYGRAIDINTWENPYLSRHGLVPNSWWHYHSHPRVAWRSSSHPVMKIWRANGFRWTYGNSDAHHYDGRMTPQWGTMIG